MRRFGGLLLLVLLLFGCAPKPRDLRTAPVLESGSRVVDYSVVEGDSWQSISESFFGSARNAERIAAENLALGATPRAGTVVRIKILDEEFELVRAIAEARGPYNAGVEAMALDGHDEEAKAAFEQAIEKAPHFVDARYNLALVLLRMGQPRAAIKQLEPVRAERPQDAETAYALGAAWFHAGDFGRAVTELERALDLQPDLLRARYTYALALERSGRTLDAKRAFQSYLSLDSESAWANEARERLRELSQGG